MPNSTVPAAATGLPVSRRFLLTGLAAAHVSIAAHLPALSSEADPVFEAIERHRAQRALLVAIKDEDEWAAAETIEFDLWKQLIATIPTSLAGAAAFAAYVADYPELQMYVGEGEARVALVSLAEALIMIRNQANGGVDG
jgi:hypothetical protein